MAETQLAAPLAPVPPSPQPPTPGRAATTGRPQTSIAHRYVGEPAAPPPEARQRAGVREANRRIPVAQLAWDYSQTMGQIRPLTDDHVLQLRANVAAVPPEVPVHVTVVPADALGVPLPAADPVRGSRRERPSACDHSRQ